MSSVHSRIQQVIAAHIALTAAYQHVLISIENQRYFFRYDFELKNPLNIVFTKKFSFIEKVDAFFFAITYFGGQNNWFELLEAVFKASLSHKKNRGLSRATHISSRRIVRPFLKYLVQIHIRVIYQRLYELYLREVLQSSSSKTDVDELRKIAEDVKNYMDTLPSPKRIVLSAFGAISIFATLIEVFGVRTLLLEALPSVLIILLPVSVVLGIIIVIVVIFPMRTAFHAKRMLFLNSKSLYHIFDFYLDDLPTVYANSIYKFENDLFQLLGSQSKPKETPFDKIVTVVAGIALVSFFGYIFLDIGLSPVQASGQPQTIPIAFAFFALVYGTFLLVFLPVLEFHWRKRSKLL